MHFIVNLSGRWYVRALHNTYGLVAVIQDGNDQEASIPEPANCTQFPPPHFFFAALEAGARDARLSQRQLGHLLGMSKATGGVRSNRYEQQASKSDIPTAANLAAVLKVPLAYLFADSSEMADYIPAFMPA